MKAYIIVLVIAITFAGIGEYFLKRKNKILGVFNIGISILSLCVVAGVRDLTIGTDIMYYYYQLFYDFSIKGISLIREMKNATVEPGFVILVYITSLLNNVNVSMGIIEFISILPIYILAYKLRDKESIVLVIYIYITTMYVRSFNLIRQSISMTIVILAAYYFYNKKYKKAIILTFLACSVHISAIISCIIYFIIYLSEYKTKNKYYWICLVYAIMIIMVIFSSQLLNLFGGRYARYVTDVNNVSIKSLSILKKMFWICISGYMYLWNLKFHTSNSNQSFVVFNLFVMDFILFMLSTKIPNAGRIGYYFINLGYILFGINFVKMFKQKKLIVNFVGIIYMIFWVNMTAVVGTSDSTYPYISNILKFLN